MKNIVEVTKFKRETTTSAWRETSQERETLSWRQIIEATGFFIALGGRETTRGKTHTSVSPDELEKVTYRLVA